MISCPKLREVVSHVKKTSKSLHRQKVIACQTILSRQMDYDAKGFSMSQVLK